MNAITRFTTGPVNVRLSDVRTTLTHTSIDFFHVDISMQIFLSYNSDQNTFTLKFQDVLSGLLFDKDMLWDIMIRALYCAEQTNNRHLLYKHTVEHFLSNKQELAISIMKNALVERLNSALHQFRHLAGWHELLTEPMNNFGFGVLFYYFLRGDLTSEWMTRNKHALFTILVSDKHASEPSSFFDAFQYILSDVSVIIQNCAYLLLPSARKEITFGASSNNTSFNDRLSYSVLWPINVQRIAFDEANLFPNSDHYLARHLYFTFNYPHWHVFPTITHYMVFCYYNVLRSWQAHVRSQGKELVTERRLNYVSVHNSAIHDTLSNEDKRTVFYLRVLCGHVSPISPNANIKTDYVSFSIYVNTFLLEYTYDLQIRFGMILTALNIATLNRHQYTWFTFHEQLIALQASLEPYMLPGNFNAILADGIRLPIVPFTVTIADVSPEHQTKAPTTRVGYPSGPAIDVGMLTLDNYFDRSILSVLSQSRHLVSQLFLNFPLCEDAFTVVYDLNNFDFTLLTNLVQTYSNRKHDVRVTKDALMPKKFYESVSKSLYAIDGDVNTTAVIQAYCVDAPVPQNPAIREDALEPKVPDANSSTLKLVTLFVQSYCLYQNLFVGDVTEIDFTTTSGTYLILGAITEPAVGVIDRLTRGKWRGTSIGREAVSPNLRADIADIIVSNSYNVIISDINTETRWDTRTQVVPVDEILRVIAQILLLFRENSATILICKINYLIVEVFDLINDFFPDEDARPFCQFLKSQFSPYASNECFLVIFKRGGQIPGTPTWTDLQKSNMLYTSGVFTNPVLDLPLNILSGIDYATLNPVFLKESCIKNAGCVVKAKIPFSQFSIYLSVFTTVCRSVTYGYSYTDNVQQCEIYGVISLKKATLSTRTPFFFRVMSGDIPAACVGTGSLNSIINRGFMLLPSSSVTKSFTNGQRYSAFLEVLALNIPRNCSVIDIGGRDFEGIMFTLLVVNDSLRSVRGYTIIDPQSHLLNGQQYDIVIRNDIVTMDTLLPMLPNNIVLAYNSLFMIEGETSDDLYNRLLLIVNAPIITCFCISFYVYNPAFNHVPSINTFVTLPNDEHDGMTFGNYTGCGYLSVDQVIELRQTYLNAGILITNVLTTSSELITGCRLNAESCDSHAFPSLAACNAYQHCWILCR